MKNVKNRLECAEFQYLRRDFETLNIKESECVSMYFFQNNGGHQQNVLPRIQDVTIVEKILCSLPQIQLCYLINRRIKKYRYAHP